MAEKGNTIFKDKYLMLADTTHVDWTFNHVQEEEYTSIITSQSLSSGSGPNLVVHITENR